MDTHLNLLFIGTAVLLLLVVAVLGIGAFLLVTWLCGEDDH